MAGGSFVWTGPSSGVWGTAGNWTNLAGGAAATAAPGSADSARIGGGTQAVTVSGTGTVAALAFLGSNTVTGRLTATSLVSNASSAGSFSVGTLSVAGGGVLAATNATIGASLSVSGAGSAFRVRALTVTAPGYYAWTLDSAGTIEVGSGSSGAAGTFTIDADGVVTLQGPSFVLSGPVVDKGLIQLGAGAYASLGSLSGTGQVTLGAGAALSVAALAGTVTIGLGDQSKLTLSQSAAGTAKVSLAGRGSVLELDEQLTFPWAYSVAAPTVSDFGVDDAILVKTVLSDGAVTGATYTAGSTAGTGTLTLTTAAGTLAVLSLAGTYTGYRFVPVAAGADGTEIVLMPAAAAGSLSSGTAGHTYVWTGATAGLWSGAANWRDGTAGQAAAVAPGSRDPVSIASGPNLTQVVAGLGAALSLTLSGSIAVTGQVSAGTLVSNPGTAGGNSLVTGALSVSNGGTVSATRATMGGVLNVSGSGSRFQAGTLIASATAYNSWSVGGGGVIEVGSGSAGQAGALTVDADGLMELANTTVVQAPVVDNGVVQVDAGGSANLGVLSGSGQVRLGSGATLTAGVLAGPVTVTVGAHAKLTLAQSTATGATVALQGSGATLVLDESSGSSAVNPAAGITVSGFGPGDSIQIKTANTVATAAVYAAGAGGTGTLSLLSGTATLASITLSGDFNGYAFSVTPSGAGTASVGLSFADPLFDGAWYLARYQDVAAAGVDPYTHYMTSGWAEGRDPSPLFSASYYLAHNPDIAAARVNPLLHFETYGWKEWRNPDGLFDVQYYLQNNPDVAAAGVDPLVHYLTWGWKEGRAASLLFDTRTYLSANPDVAAAGMDPLLHYVLNGQYEGRMAFLTGGTAAADPLVDTSFYDKQLGATLIPSGLAGAQQAAWSYDLTGWKAGLNPDAWFDTRYYLAHNPDVAAANVDPLWHFEAFGWREGRDPSAQFSTQQYLAHNPDVAAAQMNPLLHYVAFGQMEGRAIFHV